jgi:hypothetical protein
MICAMIQGNISSCSPWILDASEVQRVLIPTCVGRPAARFAVLVLTRATRDRQEVAGQHLDLGGDWRGHTIPFADDGDDY